MAGTAEQADASWSRIEDWLARHAPEVRAALRPPATTATLDRVTRASAGELPSDLGAWWRRRHGLRRPPARGTLFPDHYDPVPLDDALRYRDVLVDTTARTCPPALRDQLTAYLDRCAQEPAGTFHPNEATLGWLPRWIPVAQDSAGGGLFTDLRAGPLAGCVVRYTRHGQAASPDWPDLATLLTGVADQLDGVDEEDFEDGTEITLGRWILPGRNRR